MPDKYQALREAVEKATPGPWSIGDSDLPVSHLSIHSSSGVHTTIARMVNDKHRAWCAGELVATWKFIAAANPATITTLLAERDELLHALHTALPFVEDAKSDTCLKPGVAAKAIKLIHAAINYSPAGHNKEDHGNQN